MYGMIMKALKELIIKKDNESGWEEIWKLADIGEENLIGMEPYPDQMTYKLVATASKKLGVPGSEILRDLGEFWVSYVEEDYGYLLDATGNDFVEFLQNLDNLHSRVQTLMPELIPPRILCTDIKEDSLRVHYYSTRVGLTDMVVGLLHGVGNRFKQPIEIQLVNSKEKGHDHDEFLVSLLKNEPK